MVLHESTPVEEAPGKNATTPEARLQNLGQEGVMFKCSGCGECCNRWSIDLERYKADILLNREWVVERLKAFNTSFKSVSKDLVRVPLRSDNEYCVFLGEDKLCMIQVKEGTHLKPQDCKRFPFAVAQSPDGTRLHDASAYCKSIAEKNLLAFAPIMPEVGSEPIPLSSADFPERIRVGHFKTWSLATYQQFSRDVQQIMATHQARPWLALKLVQARLLEKIPAGHLPTPETLHTNKIRPPKQQEGGAFFLRKPFGYYTWWRMLAYDEFWDQVILPAPVKLSRVKKATWPDDMVNSWLSAYAHHVMQRRVLLTKSYGYSLHQLLSLACAGSLLVKFYARALCILDTRKTVTPDDVTLAIRLVERYYTGHQPLFLAGFSGLPFSGWFHHWLLRS